MAKKKKSGAVAGMLMNQVSMGRLMKPSLHVTASMDGGMYPDDGKYHRQEVKRLHHEIKGIKHTIKHWDPKSVSDQALKSLHVDLASKRARLAESKARLGLYGSKKKKTKSFKLQKSDDEEPEDESEAEEAVDNEWA